MNENPPRPGPEPADLNRRGFVMTGLTAGFALAVQPVSADTITTDTRGLVAGEVKVTAADEVDIPAYRAMPAAGGPFPVVLVVHEIWGVHEYIKDVCRRLAKVGYMAVAPELYARQGDTSRLQSTDKIFEVVNKVPDVQVMADLDATAAWAKQTGKGDVSRLGVTGFCWGGRIVWLYAAHNKDLKAGVAWYGHVVGGKDKNHPVDELHPKYPIDLVAHLKARVLGLYGADDASIPVEGVEKMRDALKKAEKTAEVVVYPNTPHGFHADYRPSYRKDEAEDGWKRMLEWFKKYGVG
jgi:carboxymethylenebutenolidase